MEERDIIYFPQPTDNDPMSIMKLVEKERVIDCSKQLDRVRTLLEGYAIDMTSYKTRSIDPETNEHYVAYAATENMSAQRVSFSDDPDSALLAIAQDHAFSDEIRKAYFVDDKVHPVDMFIAAMLNEYPRELENLEVAYDADLLRKLCLFSLLEDILGVAYKDRKYKDYLTIEVERIGKVREEILSSYKLSDIQSVDPDTIEWGSKTASYDFLAPHSQELDLGDERKKGRRTGKHLVSWSLVFAIGGGLLVTCTDNSTSKPDRTLPSLPTQTVPSTLETTTTLLQDKCEVWPVQQGDTLSAIAAACDVTEGALKAANPSILNVNDIFPGQQIIIPDQDTVFTLPPTTTTSTTVPATTTTVQVAPQTTVTVPAPTTTAPPAPPTTVNTGVLTEAQCLEKGGIRYRAMSGDSLWKVTPVIYPKITASNQIAAFIASPLIAEYRLEQLTASTEGQKGAECFPKYDLVAPFIPVPK